MLTYSQLLTEYQYATGDTTSSNQTTGGTELNSAIKEALGEDDWIFLEKTATGTTVASQQGYILPADFAQMRTVTVTVGTTVWSVVQAPSRQFWDQLNVVTFTSDIPNYYYILGKRIYLYPTPASSSNTITYDYKKKVGKLSVTDYTTGTIAITSGDETVTGTATTFTSSMAGLALMTTDGLWYDINTYTSATSLELLQPYLGATISGATYTIGQLSPIPDAYEMLPVYGAAADYFRTKGNKEKTEMFEGKADALLRIMKTEQGAKSTSPRIRSDAPGTVNPNLFMRL